MGLTDPVGNRTTWTYDANDRITAEANPLGTTTYAYDADGEETATTDANGRQTTYSYNANGDQTGETWVGSSPSEIITYTYDADDEMTGAKDAFSTLTFTYDADGEQLTAGTSSPGGQPTVTLTSTYDSLGNRATLSDGLSSAGVLTYSYDSMHQMTGIASSYGGTTGPQISFTYDNAGRMTKIARTAGYVIVSGPFHSMGTLTLDSTLSYDADSRLTTIIHDGSGSTVLETYTYDYNAASELTAETNHEGTFSYTYDADGELTGVSNASSATYTYDQNGNRTMTGYSTGSDNELTAGAGYTYTYDSDGNMTGKTQTSTGNVWTYTWDYRNRLTNVVEKTSGGTVLMTGTYTYDALDRRIGVDETVSGTETKTWTVYDGVNAYADFNGSGTLLNRYLYGPGANEILARISSSGTTAWYLADNEGSIRDIVSTSGSVLDHIAYDAYGNVTSESSPSNGDRFKFDGMAWDAAIELYSDEARYYDPKSGRFLIQDPTGFVGGDENLYRYTMNEPTDRIDTTGLDAKQLAGATLVFGTAPGIRGVVGVGKPSTPKPVIYPTGGFLATQKVVIDKATQLFNDSNSGKQTVREMGTGIYWHPKTKSIKFLATDIVGNPTAPGALPTITFRGNLPIELPGNPGYVLVGTIHTHPELPVGGIIIGLPSPHDSPLDPANSMLPPDEGQPAVPWLVREMVHKRLSIIGPKQRKDPK